MAQSNEFASEVKNSETSKKTLVSLISIIVLLVVIIAVETTLFLTGVIGVKTAKGGSTDIAEAPKQPAIYHPLDPPFVVNFHQQSQHRVRFLQVKIEAMAREAEVIEAIKAHTPAIRNNLLLLLSRQDYENVRTVEGKEQLRATARGEINQILESQAGITGVEAIYFTSFVMQ